MLRRDAELLCHVLGIYRTVIMVICWVDDTELFCYMPEETKNCPVICQRRHRTVMLYAGGDKEPVMLYAGGDKEMFCYMLGRQRTVKLYAGETKNCYVLC